MNYFWRTTNQNITSMKKFSFLTIALAFIASATIAQQKQTTQAKDTTKTKKTRKVSASFGDKNDKKSKTDSTKKVRHVSAKF